MTAMICWTFETRWGTFGIVPKNDRFVAKFNEEDLGIPRLIEYPKNSLVMRRFWDSSLGHDSRWLSVIWGPRRPDRLGA
ncbi:MAG: hypothetical protein ACREC0_15440, partial [Methylocella sp.]